MQSDRATVAAPPATGQLIPIAVALACSLAAGYAVATLVHIATLS